MSTTIVAPATPSGRGGVAVIRISGPYAVVVGRGLCGTLPDSWSLKPCVVSSREGEEIDRGLVVFFRAPKSYTGEDVVEIHCHGSPIIVDLIIKASLDLGACMAEPGEFTKRAFLNNKIDLAQAESVADLIAAKTDAAVLGAGGSLSGEFSKVINQIVERVTALRARVEALIDFPDDEVDAPSIEEIVVLLNEELGVVSGLVEGASGGVLLREGVKLVILGPPNCGKSTLLNYLAQSNQAIVSDHPGTTRDPIRVDVNIGGLSCEFVDTAGIREAAPGSVEDAGINRSFDEVSSCDLVVLLTSDDAGPWIEVGDCVKFIKVLNKCDLLKNNQPSKYSNCIFISALTGEGIQGFYESVFDGLGVSYGFEVPYLARRRHLDCLNRARSSLVGALGVLKTGSNFELCAEDLKSARCSLGDITEPLGSEELLEEIFSEFCIGK